jgi:hypothetical protein
MAAPAPPAKTSGKQQRGAHDTGERGHRRRARGGRGPQQREEEPAAPAELVRHAPLGSANRKAGNAVAVCTSATMVLLSVRVVISHAAATSHIHTHRLAATHTHQRAEKRRLRSGPQAAVAVRPSAIRVWGDAHECLGG